MACAAGPDVAEDGLVLALDVANRKCISPLGCTGFNNAPQLVKNLVSQSDTINSYNGVKLGNLSYYTIFAIDYPEGSYGGAAAGRHGITPGYNVTSGTKLYDSSRALHLWVWNNSTSSWVSDSYFNGLRLNGHCYDSYVGTAEVDLWVSDFNNIKNTFGDDITVIASGSHRDSYHTSAQYEILRDLGAPSNVNSIIGFSSPEWILVGEPGLGAGNAYGWAFQNYSTNPTQVAHLNMGLPIYGGTGNYLEFDGVDDYIQANVNTTTLDGDPSLTVDMFVRRRTGTNIGGSAGFWGIGGSGQGNSIEGWTPTANLIHLDVYDSTRLATSYYYPEGEFTHICWTKNGPGTETTNVKCYINGVEVSLTKTRNATRTNQLNTSTNGIGICLGRINANSSSFHAPIDIGSFKVYDRALTSNEVQQNFNANRSRFGI